MCDKGGLFGELYVLIAREAYPRFNAIMVFEEMLLPIFFRDIEGVKFWAAGYDAAIWANVFCDVLSISS